MAKIPTILEAGRADGKLIKTNSVYDDNQEKFLSDKLEEIDDNHNTLTNIVNNNELDIENKLKTETARANEAENNLRTTINNITDINQNATTANTVTVDTIPNTSVSNVQQALIELFKNATFAGIATPTTDPGIPNSPVFYFAFISGIYSNFNNISIDEKPGILTWNNNKWTLNILDFASTDAINSKLTELNLTTNEHSDSITQINIKLDKYAEKINANITTERIEDGAVTTEKISTSAFDSTLSVSGKIAPADVVGEKLTELDKAVGDFSQKNTEEDGFYICDAEGNVLIRIDILDTKGGIGNNLAASIKAIVQSVGADGFSKIEAGELGENIKELIKNDAPDPVKMVAEDGFYICNEKGESVAKFMDEKWEFLNFNEYKPESVKFGFVQKKGNISSGEKWVISRNSVKHDKIITFSGTFNKAFNSLTIGHGNHIYNKEESWIDVDETNITLHCINYGTSEYTGFPRVIPHGLSIKNNIQIEIDATFNYKGKIKLVSNGHEFVTEDIHWWASSGDVFITSSSNLSNCSFSWLPKTINGVWLFGDSYFTTGQNSKDRWTSYLFANGYDNFMLNGFPGATSIHAYNDLIELLKIHTPEKIVWCMGMNNPDSDIAINDSWKSTTENVIDICNENNIELILATIPTVVGGWNADTQSNNLGVHKYKNAYIKASGLRYIDFASAVGANETTGEWYNNGQSDDMLENYGVQGKGRIHPTKYGALALYHQAITDCPELCK